MPVVTEEGLLILKRSKGGNCAVKDCGLKAISEVIEVCLEKLDGEEFLFTTRFCVLHAYNFKRYPSSLVLYVKEGKIRGINPRILK